MIVRGRVGLVALVRGGRRDGGGHRWDVAGRRAGGRRDVRACDDAHRGGLARRAPVRPRHRAGHGVVREHPGPAGLRRPLGRAGSRSGSAGCRRRGDSVGTVVAMEGGPGYPSTGTAPDFVAMIGGLHRDHDLLLVDARGTGRSTAIDCAPLQAYGGSTATDHFRALVARLRRPARPHLAARRRDLGARRRPVRHGERRARPGRRGQRPMHLGRVDLYGDSYGSWFAQVFTARYPQLLRSVTLDSTYEVRDLDPWYLTSVQTARTAFDAACARSLACSAQAPGSVWARIGSLAAYLRAHPVSGWTTGTDAAPLHVTVDMRALVDMVNDAGYDYAQYRTLDAAGRALLDARRRRSRCCASTRRTSAGTTVRLLPARPDVLLRRRLLRGRVHRLPAAVLDDGDAGAAAHAAGGGRGRAAGRDVRAVHARRVGAGEPVHRGVHRVPGLAGAGAPRPPAALGDGSARPRRRPGAACSTATWTR